MSHTEKEVAAEQELRGVIDLHADTFDQGQQTATMLHAIVDLSDLTVADVMLHRRDMRSVAIGQPIDSLLNELLGAKHSLVPLWGKTPEDIVGVIDVRTLLAELARRGGNADGLDVSASISAPWFIPDTTGLLDQLKAFRARHLSLAFVVDEYGVLQGMLTLADILEEIVGSYDRGQFNALAVPKPLPDGSFILDGRFPLRELNRELDWDLPDDHASTIAGLVLHVAERLPEPGERFQLDAYHFQVIARKKNSLAKIKVRHTLLDGA
jgi:Mg2+/Co2+ transporter CorB